MSVLEIKEEDMSSFRIRLNCEIKRDRKDLAETKKPVRAGPLILRLVGVMMGILWLLLQCAPSSREERHAAKKGP